MITFMKSYTVSRMAKDLDNPTVKISSNSDYRDEIVVSYDMLIGDTRKQGERELQIRGIKPFFFTERKGEIIILTDHTLKKLNGDKDEFV